MYYKINVNEKIKAINNKIEQNKASYDLDRETAKMLVYHQDMLVNMNSGEDLLPEKGPSEKAETITRFEYSPLGCELKRQPEIAKK